MALHVVDSGGRAGSFHRGDRLRKAREDANIQVQTMAELLGVDRGTIRRYERNQSVKRWTVEAYEKHTGFAYAWLEHGEMAQGDGGLITGRTGRYPGRYPHHTPVTAAAAA